MDGANSFSHIFTTSTALTFDSGLANKVSNNSLCIDWNKINAEAKSALFSIGWLSGCGSLEVEKKNILACVNKEYWNNGCHLEDFLIDIYDETGNL